MDAIQWYYYVAWFHSKSNYDHTFLPGKSVCKEEIFLGPIFDGKIGVSNKAVRAKWLVKCG